MMKKRLSIISLALALALLLTLFAGCSRAPELPVQTEPAASAEPAPVPADEPAPSGEPEAAAEPAPERQDGERFEAVIILEGMEETVNYEHVKNDALGFEMDYDYESLMRRSEADRELFISVWDDPDAPENYLEVRYDRQPAEAVAEAVAAVLSLEYEISRNDAFELERAGSCIRIDASEAKGGGWMPDKLQTVYIIPAPDGCRIATAHCVIEAAEGFGRRFHYMMETFSAIPARGETPLTDEQALAAIRNYTLIRIPGLEDAEGVYWEIASSDEAQVVVVFRSYTGALSRYYVDRASGETRVTEQVPGIADEERATDESLNAWAYVF